METTENNNVQNESQNGCLRSAGGCVTKLLAIIAFAILLTFVKTCSKGMMRQAVRNNYETEYVTKDKSEIDAHLYKVMDEIRADLPKQIDVVTTEKDVDMDDYNFYYICDLDDSNSQFSTLDDSTLKATQKKGLTSILPGMRKMVEVLVQTNRGLVYRYNGTSSGVTRDIQFSCQELSEMLANS